MEKNIDEGGGARPGSATLTEEEDATQHPKAIDMTGIEAEVRAKGLGWSIRSGGTGAYLWADHHASLSAGVVR